MHGFRHYPPIVQNTSWLSDRNFLSDEEIPEKALIPLPPTGFASLFCAKVDCGVNDTHAQARRGVCGLFGNCAVCKVLQKNERALHDAPSGVT